MRKAFTLIELLISISLGMAIVMITVSGFRLAAQSTTIANRMSMENALLRAGMARAAEELDFWIVQDDPDRSGRSAISNVISDDLRQAHSDTILGTDPGTNSETWKGLPFTPFSHPNYPTSPDTTIYVGFPSSSAVANGTESARGWNPVNDTWSPHDPRSWFRGNLNEMMLIEATDIRNRNDNDLRFGRYGLFSNTAASIPASCMADVSDLARLHFDYSGSADADPHSMRAGNGYGTQAVAVAHTWLPNQVSGLIRSLGFFGAMEYLPPNAFISWYQPASTTSATGLYAAPSLNGKIGSNGMYDSAFEHRTSSGGLPYWLMQPHARDQWTNTWGAPYLTDCFLSWQRANDPRTPRSIQALSHGSNYVLIHPRIQTSTNDSASLYQGDRQSFQVVLATQGSVIRRTFLDLESVSHIPTELMPAKPTHWGNVSIRVVRDITQGRHATLCRIQRTSPLTGEILELSFCGFGTTLRGARQQRSRNVGGGTNGSNWVDWDNSGSYRTGPGRWSGITLDGY